MIKYLIVLILNVSVLFAADLNTSINQAKQKALKGNYKDAVEIMKNAVEEYPDSASAHTYYGMYLTRRAGEVSFMKAGAVSSKAFKQLDIALKINPNDINARLYRGILSAHVPKFMGHLNQGIKDLKEIKQKYPNNEALYLTASYYLGLCYEKAEKTENALDNFKHIVMYGKSSEYYKSSKEKMLKLNKSEKQVSSGNEYEKAQKLLTEGKEREALKLFRIASLNDPNNLELHLIYARTIGNVVESGYDGNIRNDVTDRAGLAHEVYEVLSHCVELAPDDEEIRLLRGSVAIDLPFFVNSLETGISDMEYLIANSNSAEIKSQCVYLKRKGMQRKQIFEMAEKGYNAKTEEEKKILLSQFIPENNPVIQKQPDGKSLKVSLSIGYRDQISPQTAIWVEDENGNYLETIYVSAFASFVKDKQIHLPRWAKSSEFKKTENVTGASIDCGTHIFYWNYENCNLDNIVLKAEICHWPHIMYSKYEIPINLKVNKKHVLSNGDFLITEIIAEKVNK